MIACVDNPKVIVLVNGQIVGSFELSQFGAGATPLEEKLALGRKLLDSIEFTILGNVAIPFGVDHDVGDQAKLSGFKTIGSTQGLVFKRRSIR